MVASMPDINRYYILEILIYQWLTRVRWKLTLVKVNGLSIFNKRAKKSCIVNNSIILLANRKLKFR